MRNLFSLLCSFLLCVVVCGISCAKSPKEGEQGASAQRRQQAAKAEAAKKQRQQQHRRQLKKLQVRIMRADHAIIAYARQESKNKKNKNLAAAFKAWDDLISEPGRLVDEKIAAKSAANKKLISRKRELRKSVESLNDTTGKTAEGPARDALIAERQKLFKENEQLIATLRPLAKEAARDPQVQAAFKRAQEKRGELRKTLDAEVAASGEEGKKLVADRDNLRLKMDTLRGRHAPNKRQKETTRGK